MTSLFNGLSLKVSYKFFVFVDEVTIVKHSWLRSRSAGFRILLPEYANPRDRRQTQMPNMLLGGGVLGTTAVDRRIH